MKNDSQKRDEMDNQQVTQVELAWLAGFIDGDGCLAIYKQNDRKTRRIDNTFYVSLSITNCEEELILKSRDIIRKLGVNTYIRSSNRKGVKRDVYELKTKRMVSLSRVLPSLIPYLTGSKKKRAELVVEFCESRINQKPEDMPKIENGGRINSGTHKPLTFRQWEIIEECGKLSARGTSETTRMAARKKSEIYEVMKNRERKRNGQRATVRF